MDFETIRPILSGLIGATIAGWLAVKWVNRLPHANDRSEQKRLVEDHKGVIRFANIGAAIGLATGLILYFGGFMDDRDWRGIGLMLGLTALLPVLVIVIGNLPGGIRQVREGFAAYALAQNTPSALLFPLMGLMVLGGIWAAIALTPTDEAQEASDDRGSAHAEWETE